jgi:hypothetical protein
MATKKTALRSNKFERVGDVALDARKRVSLAKALASLNGSLVKKRGTKNGRVHFVIHVNDAGQILLSPAVATPLREAWFYKNPKTRASVLRGMRQAAQGKLHYLGSFAKYANDEID